MEGLDLNEMSIEQLWELHDVVRSSLAKKLRVERRLLEKRLDLLGRTFGRSSNAVTRADQSHREAKQKELHPDQPSETPARALTLGRGRF
jgi:hypothetical protein